MLLTAWAFGVVIGVCLGRCVRYSGKPNCTIPVVPEVLATITLDGRPFSLANWHRVSSLGDLGASSCMGRVRQRSLATSEWVFSLEGDASSPAIASACSRWCRPTSSIHDCSQDHSGGDDVEGSQAGVGLTWHWPLIADPTTWQALHQKPWQLLEKVKVTSHADQLEAQRSWKGQGDKRWWTSPQSRQGVPDRS